MTDNEATGDTEKSRRGNVSADSDRNSHTDFEIIGIKGYTTGGYAQSKGGRRPGSPRRLRPAVYAMIDMMILYGVILLY